MIKLIIFDLDGTLVDTLQDLAVCTNAVLKQNGYTTHEVACYKAFVGNGALKLIERALAKEQLSHEVHEAVKGQFIAYYDAHVLDFAKPYEGIEELLEALQGLGIQMAIATNKPHVQAVKLVKYCFPTIQFAEVLGNQAGLAHKPDPYVVKYIMDKVGALPEEVLYIGDSDVDMQTAQNASVKGIGVSWGFRTTEELYANGAMQVIDTAKAILDLLN